MPDVRARAYAEVDATQRRILAALQVIHQGWWLGMLDSRHLDFLAGLQYPRWRQYSDDAYNASGLKGWEAAAVADHFPKVGALLVGAAGGGREVVALTRLGYRVDSFDCVEALVTYSRGALQRMGTTARVHLARPGQVPDGLDHYAGTIVGWGGYMHIPGRAHRIAFLQALRRHVDAGAPLLVSFFTRPGPSRRLDWVWRIARAMRWVRRSRDLVEYGDTLDGTFDHLFTRDEVEQEMAAAGYELVAYAEAPYGHAVGRAVGRQSGFAAGV